MASKGETHAKLRHKSLQSGQSTSDLRPDSAGAVWQTVYLKFSLPLENGGSQEEEVKTDTRVLKPAARDDELG